MKFVLKRLSITGPLDENVTPVEVIEQCMSSHGLEPDRERLMDISDVRYRRKCISKLRDIPPLHIHLETTNPPKKEMGRAVRYINSKTVFASLDAVVKALHHLLSWERNSFPASGSAYGPITDDFPENLDCTMVYKLCRRENIPTRPEHTLEDMVGMLELSERASTERLRDFFIDRVMTMSVPELLGVFHTLLPSSAADLSMHALLRAYPERRGEESLWDPLKTRIPRTGQEAVILAAKNFRVNISESLSPLMEYALLLKSGVSDKSFPIDSNLQAKIGNDPHAIRLDQRFFPELPEFLYCSEDLRKMALEEGWCDSNGDPSHYDFLKKSYYENTFYAFGRGPMSGVMPENETLKIELTPYSEEEPHNLVLWGSRDRPQNMICLTWSELLLTFENYGEFRNPIGREGGIFEAHTIRKLNILAKKPCISRVVAERRKRLVAVIERVYLSNHERMERLNLVRNVFVSDEERRGEMEKLLLGLFRVTLAMRSHRDGEEMVGGEGGGVDIETAQINVGLRLIDLHDLLGSSQGWVRETFLQLPIVLYYAKEGKFSVSESSFEGYTIGGRMKIVCEGEGTPAMSSCMRLSSNWFLSTVCYYQLQFGFPVSFDVTRIVHIG